MSLLSEQPINQTLTQLLALAEDEQRPEREKALTPELRAGFERIFSFTRLLRDLLDKSAPEEVSLNGLGMIQANLQQAFSEASAFISSGNQAHLNNALSHIDNASTIFAWAFYNRPVRGAKPQFESVESVRRASEKAIAAIEGRSAEFQTALSAGQARLEEQDSKVAQLATTMEEIRGSAAAAVAAIQQQFSENLSAFRGELDVLKEGFRAEQQHLRTSLSESAEGFIKELETQRDKAAKIVQVVGNIGVTGNYQKLADDERKAANRWRLGAIAFFAVGIAMVIGVLLDHLFWSDDSSVELLVTRFAIAAVVTLPALYAASESSRHRRVANAARQTELQLASLNPFLATLPDERREALIESLTPDYFGRQHDSVALSSDKETYGDLAKILDQIASIIVKAKA